MSDSINSDPRGSDSANLGLDLPRRDAGHRRSGRSTDESTARGTYGEGQSVDAGPGSLTQVVRPGDDSEARRSLTKQRIVEAAADVFREKGFTGTRVVDIARRAGFTSGALYGYFDSRAELLAEAVGDASGQVLDHVFDGVDARQSDVGDLMSAVLDQISVPLEDSGQMLLDGLALSDREPVVGERLAAALGNLHGQLAGTGSQRSLPNLSTEAEELIVVLILGVTASRALGLHNPLPEGLGDALASAVDSTSSEA